MNKKKKKSLDNKEHIDSNWTKKKTKFENKYFSSPLKKKEKKSKRSNICVSSLFVHRSPTLSEALRNMDNILFLNGHAVHRMTRPLT